MHTISSRGRALWILILSGTVITIAHFVVGAGTHELHVVHIILAGCYLPVIIAAATWFGIAGAFLSTTVVTAFYISYVLIVWPNQPMENANQFAMVAVYWVVAITTGALVRLREGEMQRHLMAERASDRRAIIEAIAGLSNALRARDEYTREHSEHVAALAVGIARELGFPEDRIEVTRLAALVHDIGKIGVRDDVLLKPGELSEEERNSVQQHPKLAADILRAVHGTREIARIVLAHHECPDGSGYPSGLKEEAIPIEARVVRVADVYASLVEERPYKEAMDPKSAFSFMSQKAGSKYDFESIEALGRLLKLAG